MNSEKEFDLSLFCFYSRTNNIREKETKYLSLLKELYEEEENFVKKNENIFDFIFNKYQKKRNNHVC